MGHILLHVNFLEQGQSIIEICRKAADFGFDGVEFRRRGVDGLGSQEEYLAEICRGIEVSRLEVVSFGGPGPNLMSDDPAAIALEVEEAIFFYESAARCLPLSVLNVFSGPLINPQEPTGDYGKHGSNFATPSQWNAAVRGYQTIASVAVKLGLRMAFETHMYYIHDTACATRRLVDAVDSEAIGINLDLGNTLLMCEAPSAEEQISECGDKLMSMHLKNFQISYSGEKVPCELCAGSINYRAVLRKAIRQGFSGPICLEAPRPGDGEWFAREDLSYLKALLTDLREELQTT